MSFTQLISLVIETTMTYELLEVFLDGIQGNCPIQTPPPTPPPPPTHTLSFFIAF